MSWDTVAIEMVRCLVGREKAAVSGHELHAPCRFTPSLITLADDSFQ